MLESKTFKDKTERATEWNKPGGHGKSNPCQVCAKTCQQPRHQTWMTHRDRSRPNPACPCPDHSTGDHRADLNINMRGNKNTGSIERTRVGNVCGAHYTANLVHRLEILEWERWNNGETKINCLPGDKPPWQQKIFSSITAATGRQLKQSVNVFHSLTL